MKCLFEEVHQFYFSPKSFQIPKERNTLVFKCYCIIKFVYVYQVTPSLALIGIFFIHDCFYITLLIIMFIRCLTYSIESEIALAIFEK